MTNKRDNPMEQQAGVAYAFFDCRASKQEIATEIDAIRPIIGIPGELELQLTEPINLKGNQKITQIARMADEAGIKYAIQATYSGATNEQTADELAAVMIQACQSQLYEQGENFRRHILFERNGEYFHRD